MNDSSRGRDVFRALRDGGGAAAAPDHRVDERQPHCAKAHYNTDLIPQDLIYIDLPTDSGVSASSTGQFAAAGAIRRAGHGVGVGGKLRVYGRLAAELQSYFGFRLFRADDPGSLGGADLDQDQCQAW